MDFLLPDEATMEKMALEYEKIKQQVKALNSEIERANLSGLKSDFAQNNSDGTKAVVSDNGETQTPDSNGSADSSSTDESAENVPTIERRSFALPSMLLYIMLLSNRRR